MEHEELIAKLEALQENSQDLLQRSDARIDKTADIVHDLIRAISQNHQEKELQFQALQKRVEEARKDKEACIARYEKKLDRVMSQVEKVQKQNGDLVDELRSKDRQIAKLESILLSQLDKGKIELQNNIK